MKTLNDQIWGRNKKIVPAVRKKLLEIARIVSEEISDLIEVEHIYFTGSLATYKWTPLSDIDLHVIVDIKKPICDGPLQDYLDLRCKTFNKDHNIYIKGFKVEVNMKKQETRLKGKGIYDLVENEWVAEPSPVTKFLEDEDVLELAGKFQKKIDKLIINGGGKDAVDELKAQIKLLRSEGLKNEGEYSVGNLAFKRLRNTDYIAKLFKYRADLVDKELSLETFKNYFSF